MKAIQLCIAIFLLTNAFAQPLEPVNKAATPEAKALLSYLSWHA